MDSIDHELLPYGGMMTETVATVPLTPDEWRELESGLNEFTTDQEGLNRIQQLNVIKKFGDQWLVAIRAALGARPDLMDTWTIVMKTYRAYYLWKVANDILEQPLSERARAQLQADMPEYETYLPMFGDAGTELLEKLRSFITTMKPVDTDAAPDAQIIVPVGDKIKSNSRKRSRNVARFCAVLDVFGTSISSQIIKSARIPVIFP